MIDPYKEFNSKNGKSQCNIPVNFPQKKMISEVHYGVLYGLQCTHVRKIHPVGLYKMTYVANRTSTGQTSAPRTV